MKNIFFLFGLAILLTACGSEDNNPKLIVKYVFDANQERLDNFGNPATVPANHAAQTPDFQKLGVHSLELIQIENTIPSNQTIIFTGAETDAGGSDAIDYAAEKIVSNGEVAMEIPLSDITPGTYNYLRNSLAYQEYVIDVLYNDPMAGSLDLTGHVASFIGFNNYITSHTLAGVDFPVNGNELQGYFAFALTNPIPYSTTGNAPATTVVNPLPNSPIPAGSCLVTGAINTPLVITGNETDDIVIEVSVSTNNSFEWEEINADGKYEPVAGETVVDMGVRGIQVTIQ